MATPQEIRKTRLKNDFAEMMNIKGNMIQWEIVKGEAPYVEEYKLTVRVRTIMNAIPTFKDLHIINVIIPPAYPRIHPTIQMRRDEQPFHPNWYTGGNWCPGSWDMSESLAQNVLRMIRTLQFDKEITNPKSPANSLASDWYLDKINSGLFPCDTQVLPDPTKSKLTINPTKPKFEVKESKLSFKVEEEKLESKQISDKRFNIK